MYILFVTWTVDRPREKKKSPEILILINMAVYWIIILLY